MQMSGSDGFPVSCLGLNSEGKRGLGWLLRQGAVLVVVHYAGVAIVVVAVFGLFAMLASAAIVIICDISHYTTVVLARRCLWAWFCCHRYSPCSLLLAISASSYPCLDGLPTLASRLVLESPVRSSYWPPGGSNRDRDRLVFFQKPNITGPNWYRPVTVG